MAAASPASSNPFPPLKWPDDPVRTIGLTPEDIRILSIAIQHFWRRLPPMPEGHRFYVNIERKEQLTIKGSVVLLPRRLVVYGDRAFVVLNTKDGVRTVAGGASQPKMKLVYEAFTGATFLKKRIFTVEQNTLAQYLLTLDQRVSGFAEVGCVENRKGRMNYFEKEYADTLASHCQKVQNGAARKLPFNLQSLIYVQSALKSLHQMTYEPPKMVGPGGDPHSFRMPSKCWIGDISPRNCVVEVNQGGGMDIRLIDYGFALDLEYVVALPGWESPEMVAGFRDSIEFNLQYGPKKDVWQFALILGSLMQGGIIFESTTGEALPRFTFIVDKIRARNGTIDSSGLKALTQREVDEEIAHLTAQEKNAEIKPIWKVIGQWLQIDPDKRQSLGDFSIAISLED